MYRILNIGAHHALRKRRLLAVVCALALGWLLPRGAGAARAEWEVGLRDEVRVRERLAQDVGSDPVALDIELAPLMGVGIEGSGTRVDLAYAPIFTLRQPYRQAAPIMLHSLRTAQTITRGRARFTASEAVSFGDQDFGSLRQSVLIGGRLQPIPLLSRIPFQSFSVVADFSYQFTRRLSLSLFGSFLDSGGTTNTARAQLPHQQTGRAQVTLAYQAAQRHRVDWQTGITPFFFDLGQRYVQTDVSLGWEWQVAKTARWANRAGIALINNQQDERSPSTLLFLPNASSVMTHRFGFRRGTQVELSYGSSMTPLFDRITGEVYGRPSIDASLGLAFSPQWAFRVSGSVAMALRNQRPLRDVLAFGSMAVVHTTRSKVALEVGARGFVDVFVYTQQPPFTQWVVYLATTMGTKERF